VSGGKVNCKPRATRGRPQRIAVTASDWSTSTDPQQMLAFLRDRGASEQHHHVRGWWVRDLVLDKS
jgi:hypothetical protein